MFNSSCDRTGLCTFMFDDGRHCNMPHTQSELHLCYFHEKRELRRLYAVEAGIRISRSLATNLHTACDLSHAFAMLFRAGVQGHIEPKLLNSLTRLGQLVVNTHLLAKQEYLDSYDNDWSSIVLQSIALRPDPEPAPDDSGAPELRLDSEPPAHPDAAADLPRRPSTPPPPAAPDADDVYSEGEVVAEEDVAAEVQPCESQQEENAQEELPTETPVSNS
ncbi:MAG TPA: hypothetical protein VMH20_17405 [Verrucomicrobiae bacterium]|nr:hypothetical protein [Verrucomicrobiae bacterium]